MEDGNPGMIRSILSFTFALALLVAGIYFIIDPTDGRKLGIMGFFLAGIGGVWLWFDFIRPAFRRRL
jgi:hypothetical protein